MSERTLELLNRIRQCDLISHIANELQKAVDSDKNYTAERKSAVIKKIQELKHQVWLIKQEF